jgi:Uma2 family endonuclease
MSAVLAPFSPAVEQSIRRKKWTVEEVYKAISAGIFEGQKFELIHGEIIDKMGQSPSHARGAAKLQRWLATFCDMGRVRIERPLRLPGVDGTFSEPEPGFVVADIDEDDLADRHIRPNEVLLLVEVSASSFPVDSTVKRDLYARAGIEEYWIFDVNARHLLIHRHPVDGVYSEVTTAAEAAPLFAPQHTFRVPPPAP